MAARTSKYRHHANPALAEGLRQLRSSGAAGVHGDRRLRRQRTRAARTRAAVDDQG